MPARDTSRTPCAVAGDRVIATARRPGQLADLAEKYGARSPGGPGRHRHRGRPGRRRGVSSVFADRGGPTPDHSSAKHGIRGLTRGAAIEFGARGVRVNELQPGVIDTDMTQKNPEGTRKVADTGIPMRRVGTGEETACITGAHLAVDGGFLA
nr:SDR family oxidoreductase [Streptomyces sp. SPB074]